MRFVPALAEALQQGGLAEAAHALDVFDFEAGAQPLKDRHNS